MALVDGLLQELEAEAQTTRRVLEHVPGDKLDWRPHEKARTLGELAMHVAVVPGAVAEFVTGPSPVQVPSFEDPRLQSVADLVPALEQRIAKANQVLSGMDDATISSTFRLMHGDRELFSLPRVAMLRSIMLNHWYHHRGQLTVYLRALGARVPSVYGPSADENPFA